MPFTVNKSDGSSEVFLHTKVMGAIAAALGESGCYREDITEILAEAVSLYLAHRYSRYDNEISVRTDEIYSMVQAVLSDTGYELAAEKLQAHRLNRQVSRRRTEVVHYMMPEQSSDAGLEKKVNSDGNSMEDIDISLEVSKIEPWDKSKIVKKIKSDYKLEHNLTRTIAGEVEEKVLKLGTHRVLATVVNEILLNELYDMKQADIALNQPVSNDNKHAGKVIIAGGITELPVDKKTVNDLGKMNKDNHKCRRRRT